MLRLLKSYRKEKLKKTQEQEHQNLESAPMTKTKQTQDEQRLAAQIVLSQQRKEPNDYIPTKKSIKSIKLGECRPKIMDAKNKKDVPAQRVLKIEELKASEESIDEMVR